MENIIVCVAIVFAAVVGYGAACILEELLKKL